MAGTVTIDGKEVLVRKAEPPKRKPPTRYVFKSCLIVLCVGFSSLMVILLQDMEDKEVGGEVHLRGETAEGTAETIEDALTHPSSKLVEMVLRNTRVGG